MTLWLVGMMGSGKTSAGRIAAAHLEVEFIDTDEMIARGMGWPIPQLWGRMGERAFRDKEKAVTAGLAGKKAIVSTGGGVVLDDENRRLMSATGPVVWLRASPGVLAERIAMTESRPLLHNSTMPAAETLTEILGERERLYEEVATHRIDTDDLDLEEVARSLEAIWSE